MEQAKALARVLKEHPTLKSLCGNSGEETELDMSGKNIGADGAIMLAPEIAGNGALTSLDVSSNNIGSIVGWTYHSDNNQQYTHMHSDGRHQELLPEGEELGKPEGIIALADVIPDMGALSSLNLASNGLCGLDTNGLGTFDASGISYAFIVIPSSHVLDRTGITALANAIPDMTAALTSLNISDNNLTNNGRNMSGKPREHVCVWPPHLVTTFVRPLIFCRCYLPH
jgi:Leucine-rich repeat (LRR) protein